MNKGFSVLAMASVAVLTISAANAENKVVEDTKKAGAAVGNGVKKVGSATVNGIKKAGEATASGAKKVGSGLKKGAEAVGHGCKAGVEAVGHGAKKAGNAVKETMTGHNASGGSAAKKTEKSETTTAPAGK
jgi:phage-related protein